MTSDNTFISVIIPAYNEEKYISDCLNSVYKQDYPSDLMEVIVVDGNSTDRTAEIIRQQFPEVILLHNPQKIVPISMNIGIRQAKGDYIIRLDAHAFYPINYISTLISEAKRLNADNIGAVCQTLPAKNTAKAKAVSIALSTPFGMGNSNFRVGTHKIKQVDTVPFGCYHKSVFEKIGFYDEELVRNQDDELNARLIKNGGKIYLLPNLIVKYYGRDTLKKTWHMFYQYGLFKPLVNKKIGAVTSFRQLVPLGFMVYLILLFVFSIIFPSLFLWLAIPLFLYILTTLIYSIKVATNINVFGWLLVTYPSIHVAYGTGYIDGLLRLLFKQPFTAESNR